MVKWNVMLVVGGGILAHQNFQMGTKIGKKCFVPGTFHDIMVFMIWTMGHVNFA
jgi:hypothetical protein